jgi:hypothetical protein
MDARIIQLIEHCAKQKGEVKAEALMEFYGDVCGGDIVMFFDSVKMTYEKAGKAEEAKPEKKGKAKAEPKAKKVEAQAEAEKKGDDKEPEKKVEAHAEAEKKEGAGQVPALRMTKGLCDQLKTALIDAGFPCDETPFFEHAKKEFRNYVISLTYDDFKKCQLDEHMRDFAGIKSWVENPTGKKKAGKKGEAKAEPKKKVDEAEKKGDDKEPEKEEPASKTGPKKRPGRKPKAEEAEKAEEEVKKEEAKAETDKKKPGRKPKAEKEEEPEKKGDDKEPKAAKGGGAANVKPKVLTYTELMERSERLIADSRDGMFWDPEAGEMVTGPEEDADDEDDGPEDDVVKFDGKEYSVSPVTGRVYEEDAEGLHIFVGFKGVGKFKHM